MQMDERNGTGDGGQDVTLGARLFELFMLFNRLTASDSLEALYKSRITLPQLATMHALRRLGAHSVSLIAKKLTLSKAASSHLVEQLVKKGLVSRSEDSGDRRIKNVKLTAKGISILDKLDRARKDDFDSVMGFLTPELKSEFGKVLLAVILQLKEQLEKKDGDRS